jgi:hypothetical protein
MDYLQKIINKIEIHSPEGIKECFDNGISPNDYFKDKPLIYELITEYARGPKFKECFKVFVDHGLHFDDKILLAIFLDDAIALDAQLQGDKQAVNSIYSFDCAFTPLYKVSLLHICAEFNHLDCAKILVKYGADINFKAGTDEYGFGEQTPIFHTVNQHANACIDVMNYLIAESADLTLTVKGLVWGKGYQWETFIPAVNPISYAMMGLLPQFQRTEKQIYEVVSLLLKASYGIEYFPANIPNRYLKK